MNQEPTLETVAVRVAEWRETRGRNISEEIWNDVMSLCKNHPVRKVSLALGMPSTTLYRRLRKSEGHFCEVPKVPAFIQRSEISFLINIQRDDGREIKVECSRSSDLGPIFSSFFNQ